MSSADQQLEKLTSQMNDARLINMSEQVLYPLLQRHADDRVKVMCSRFRDGETNFVRDVAQISYIQELLGELNRKQIKGNKARKELEDGNG